ncbi:MAG: biopolymer transporter ExbD [Lentilitoribacter sp.]
MNIFDQKSEKQKAEPTIALINIVFLMLIFFLVSAQITAPLDNKLELVTTEELAQTPPPNHLVISADGSTKFKGLVVLLSDYVTGLTDDEMQRLRIIPDRNTSAVKLIEISNTIRQLGVKEIFLVTERSIGNEN